MTNAHQGRVEQTDGNVDWAEDWGYHDGDFKIMYTLVQTSTVLPITLLTHISVLCNRVASNRYRQYEEARLDWIGRGVIAEALFDIGTKDDHHVVLDDQFVQQLRFGISSEAGAAYEVLVETRKLGQDNGKAQVVNISGYLEMIRDYVRSVSRQPNQEEVSKMMQIMATPWGASKSVDGT